MIYGLDLRVVGLVVGAGLLLTHLLAVSRFADCKVMLKTFPRSRVAGTVLIVVAGIWAFSLIRQMDLGEFVGMRQMILFGIVAGTILAWLYVEEFLAVRALGMLLLLAATPVLEAAFLHPETTRYLVVVLAYAWILLGLFWVGMPWVMRDQILWLTAHDGRLRGMIWAGVGYGAAVLVCAMAFWK